MYADLTPLLPSKVSLWGLNLVSKFMDALSHDLQEALSTNPSYLPPDLSLLTTRSSQLDALRSLRVAAVWQFSLLRAQEKLIAKTVLRKVNPRTPGATSLAAPFSAAPPRHASFAPAGTPNDHVPVRTFMSPTEQTMSRYQPAAAASSTGACPVDPLTHFQSTFPSGFQGCMFCGSTDHVFCSCPQHNSPGASALFFKNLFAHKPHLHTRNPRPEEMLSPPSASPGPPPNQSFVATPIAPPLPNGVCPASPPALAGSAPLPLLLFFGSHHHHHHQRTLHHRHCHQNELGSLSSLSSLFQLISQLQCQCFHPCPSPSITAYLTSNSTLARAPLMIRLLLVSWTLAAL